MDKNETVRIIREAIEQVALAAVPEHGIAPWNETIKRLDQLGVIEQPGVEGWVEDGDVLAILRLLGGLLNDALFEAAR